MKLFVESPSANAFANNVKTYIRRAMEESALESGNLLGMEAKSKLQLLDVTANVFHQPADLAERINKIDAERLAFEQKDINPDLKGRENEVVKPIEIHRFFADRKASKEISIDEVMAALDTGTQKNENGVRVLKNSLSGETVTLSNGAISKMFDTTRTRADVNNVGGILGKECIANIGKIFDTALLIKTTDDLKHKSKNKIHRYANVIKSDGEPFIVKITVKEMTHNRHELTDIEIEENNNRDLAAYDLKVGRKKAVEGNSSVDKSTAVPNSLNIIINDLIEFVNSYTEETIQYQFSEAIGDLIEKAKEPASIKIIQHPKESVKTFYQSGHMGRGYVGYSMSVNMAQAQANNELPASKASKELGVSTQAIKEILTPSAWHHASSYYNKVDVYDINPYLELKAGKELSAEIYTEEEIADYKAKWDKMKNMPKPDKSVKQFYGDAKWIEWVGTRAHPKAIEHVEKNVLIEEKGSFYTIHLKDGTSVRKKIGSNGTYVKSEEEIAQEKYQSDLWAKRNDLIRNVIDTYRSAFEEYRKENKLDKPDFETFETVATDSNMTFDNFYISGQKPTSDKKETGLRRIHQEGKEYQLQEWSGSDWKTLETRNSFKQNHLSHVYDNIDIFVSKQNDEWYKRLDNAYTIAEMEQAIGDYEAKQNASYHPDVYNQPKIAPDIRNKKDDIKLIRKNAKKYMKNVIRKQDINHPELGHIRVSNKGINEFFHTTGNPDKLALIPHLKELIETARVGEKENLTHKRDDAIVAFYPLYNTAQVDDRFYNVTVKIGVDENGNLFYTLLLDKKNQSGNKETKSKPTLDNIIISHFEKNVKSFYNRGSFSQTDDNIYYQSAFAGSRVDYDKPSLEAIGTGEGAQVHGYGLYYALRKYVAEKYRKAFVGIVEGSGLRIQNKTIDDFLDGLLGFSGAYDSALLLLKNNPDMNPKTYFLQALDEYIADFKKLYKKTKISEYQNAYKKAENIRKKAKKAKDSDYRIERMGQVHEVDIPEMPFLLDEQKTWDEQSPYVKQALTKIRFLYKIDFKKAKIINAIKDKIESINNQIMDNPSQITDDPSQKDLFEAELEEAKFDLNIAKNGESLSELASAYNVNVNKLIGRDIYRAISEKFGSDLSASDILEQEGVKGITYHGARDGRCFVIFNPEDVKVIQKFYQPKITPDIRNKKVTVVDLTSNFKGIPTKEALESKINDLIQKSEAIPTKTLGALIDFKADPNRDITGHIVDSSNKTGTKDDKTRHKIVLNSIEDLIKESVFVEKGPNKKAGKKPTVEEYYRFYVPVRMRNKIYTVRLVAEKWKGEKSLKPDTVHLYDVILEDNVRNASMGKNPSSESVADIISVAQMLEGVKGFDGTFYTQGESSENYGAFSPSTNTITLFRNANLSTIIHESGHYFTMRYLDVLNKAGR